MISLMTTDAGWEVGLGALRTTKPTLGLDRPRLDSPNLNQAPPPSGLRPADRLSSAKFTVTALSTVRLEPNLISPESDPGAVAFNAVQSGVAHDVDFVVIDTAGRLHTRFNLMEELKKIQRVIGKALPGAPQAVWLVLDATTGQNALQQAKAFKEAVGITGVILSKLDSSARGGMAFAIQHELGIPILFAGLGEKINDLQPFDPDAFIDGILASP